MTKRLEGTTSPMNKAGFKRVCLALVVLLLSATLMVGAVSAVDPAEDQKKAWDELYANLTSGHDYTLTMDIPCANTSLVIGEGKTVTLNLAGFNLSNTTATSNAIITLNGGSLTIINETATPAEEPVGAITATTHIVYVIKGILTVDTGVVLDTNGGIGIVIFGNENNPQASKHSVVTINSGAIVDGGSAGIVIQPTSKGHHGVYGVELTVNGIVQTENTATNYGTFGITVNGRTNGAESNFDISGNVPVITIGETAKLSAKHGSSGTVNDDDGPVIYAAGYAKWVINGGTFIGDEALSIKAGEFTITGGKFTATGDAVTDLSPNGDGSEATGATVSITNSENYAGNVTIAISGGEFKSENFAAFFEGYPTSNVGSAADEITITGGTFTGAGDSPIIIMNSGTTEITGGVTITDKGVNQLYPGVNLTTGVTDGKVNFVAQWDATSKNFTLLSAGKYLVKAEGITISANSVKDAIVNGGLTIAADGLTITNKSSGTIKFTVTGKDTTAATTTYEAKLEITKGTDIIGFTSKDNPTATAIINDASSGATYYSLGKVGTATVEVTAAGVTETFTVSVADVATPPTDTTGITVTESSVAGQAATVTLTPGTAGETKLQSSFTPEGAPVVNIINKTDPADKPAITVVFKGSTNTDAATGAISGAVDEVFATYPVAVAPAADNIPVGYSLVISLNESKVLVNGATGITLPTIDPAYNETLAELLDDKYTAISMITASVGTGELKTFNGNISTTNPSVLIFGVEKSAMPTGKFVVFHIVDGKISGSPIIPTIEEDKQKGAWIVYVPITGFSSYVLALDTTPAAQPPKQETSQGTSEWLDETPTQQPTEQPTATPTATATPTDTVPTDVPTTSKPTEEPSSPGFGILAALAGLGAVAVLRRK